MIISLFVTGCSDNKSTSTNSRTTMGKTTMPEAEWQKVDIYTGMCRTRIDVKYGINYGDAYIAEIVRRISNGELQSFNKIVQESQKIEEKLNRKFGKSAYRSQKDDEISFKDYREAWQTCNNARMNKNIYSEAQLLNSEDEEFSDPEIVQLKKKYKTEIEDLVETAITQTGIRNYLWLDRALLNENWVKHSLYCRNTGFGATFRIYINLKVNNKRSIVAHIIDVNPIKGIWNYRGIPDTYHGKSCR